MYCLIYTTKFLTNVEHFIGCCVVLQSLLVEMSLFTKAIIELFWGQIGQKHQTFVHDHMMIKCHFMIGALRFVFKNSR